MLVLDAVTYMTVHGNDFFWLGVTYVLLEDTAKAQENWDQTLLAVEESPICFQQRIQTRVALINGETEIAHEYYSEILGGACDLRNIALEARYLQELARLFPERDDMQSINNWLENHLTESYDITHLPTEPPNED